MASYRLALVWGLRIAAGVWLIVGAIQVWGVISPAFDPIHQGTSGFSSTVVFVIQSISAAIFPSLVLAAVGEVLALLRRN